MTDLTDKNFKQFKLAKLMALVLLVVAPIVLLFVAFQIDDVTFVAEPGTELLIYLLIPIALFEPLLFKLIRRSQVSLWKKSTEPKMPPAKLYLSLMINKLSLVAAIYIYGLVAFYLTREITNLTYFYLIGIGWSYVVWPRKDRFELCLSEGPEVL